MYRNGEVGSLLVERLGNTTRSGNPRGVAGRERLQERKRQSNCRQIDRWRVAQGGDEKMVLDSARWSAGRSLQVGSLPLGQAVDAASRGRRSEGSSRLTVCPLHLLAVEAREAQSLGSDVGSFTRERGLGDQQDPGRSEL